MTFKGQKMIYCAYVRVSTDTQDVARQENEIKKWLGDTDHQVIWFKEQGVSGKVAPELRPELSKCIDTVRASKGTLIVADLDRFSRTDWHTLKFFDQVLKNGKVRLVVCNDPTISESKDKFALRTLFAQMEQEKISERTRSALQRIKDEIKANGTYKTKSGKLISSLGCHSNMDFARQRSAEVIKLKADTRVKDIESVIQKLLSVGDSYRQIASQLNQMGANTARGGKWHASTVSNAVKRLEKNYG